MSNPKMVVADLVLRPFMYPAGYLLRFVRRTGMRYLPRCRKALQNLGVFPIMNHYYEPQFRLEASTQSLSEPRILPGIDWNVSGQLSLLEEFCFSSELGGISSKAGDSLEFHFRNDSFEPGDAEYFYNFIRLRKPRRIIEIGSGYSTLIAVRAIRKNSEEDRGCSCEHYCIEPYEMPWLERMGVSLLRKKVEDLDPAFFGSLEENDILFIDSSHMIRPRGDVLFEYLTVLPSLKKGVIVHIHDIFTPRDYPAQWLLEDVRFWNEQYLLEAFLTSNADWRIIGALNFLHHEHYDQLAAKCPYLRPEHMPGSFYMQRIS